MKKIFLVLLFLLSTTFLQAQVMNSSLVKQLTGTWALISVDNIYPDGSRVHPYGDSPKGLLTLTANGTYAIQIYKALRPKIASGDKNKATSAENEAMVQGSNAHFGNYDIDERRKVISFKVAYATFPNWEGTIQDRAYTFFNNELKYVVTHTTQGGKDIVAEVSWRKLD